MFPLLVILKLLLILLWLLRRVIKGERLTLEVIPVKICVVGKPQLRTSRVSKYCDLLAHSKESPLSCVYGTDRLECLQAVSRREADFGIFEAEDLYYSSLWGESTVLVVSEIRGLKNSLFEFGTVALVNKNSNITGIADLRGRTLCHPGSDSGLFWDSLFTQYFEYRVAPSSCDQQLSIDEDRIKSTSEFFLSACKAGPWVADPVEDARLKDKYRNLCGLCDSGTCGDDEKYRGSGGSITCFKDGIGEVLWARYEDVKVHLKFLEDGSNGFEYMCDDGTFMSSDSPEPCIWLAKPWQVVVAHRKSATAVQKIVGFLQDEIHYDWEENFLHVIELYQKYVLNIRISRTPEDYLRGIPGYLSASAMSQSNCNPRHSVRLCVSSPLEEQKCVQLARAATTLAIQPSLDCIRMKNLTVCLDSVRRKETDLVVVSPDSYYDGVEKFKLKNILFERGDEFKDSYLVSVLVKKKLGFKTLEDLRGTKVCFTKKNGIGWKSIVQVLHDKSYIDSNCGGQEALFKFFKEICFAKNNEKDSVCCPHLDTIGSEDENILHCLQDGGCDVAVIDFNVYKQNSAGRSPALWSKDIRASDIGMICRSDKSKDCYWMWSYPNYLMTSSELSFVKTVEIKNVFSQISKYFGKSSKKKNLMMELFGSFHEVRNVLFKDSSSSFASSANWNFSNNYMDIVNICSNSSPKQFYFSFGWLSFIFYLILTNLIF